MAARTSNRFIVITAPTIDGRRLLRACEDGHCPAFNGNYAIQERGVINYIGERTFVPELIQVLPDKYYGTSFVMIVMWVQVGDEILELSVHFNVNTCIGTAPIKM